MSDRGMKLALQRLHDDPGFSDMVCSDPEATLGNYDLDDEDRELLANACKSNDQGKLTEMARNLDIDWKAQHLAGVGALGDDEVSIEHQPHPTPHGPDHFYPAGKSMESSLTQNPGALSGDGYDGVHPHRPAGT